MKYVAAPHPHMSRVYGKRKEMPPEEPEPEEVHGNAIDPRRHLIRLPRVEFLERRLPGEERW